MGTTQRIERFIEAKKSESRDWSGDKRFFPGTVPFVTISSQSGAGGNRLAQELLELFGRQEPANDTLRDWRLFDKSMCRHVLDEAHVADSMNDLLNKEYHSQIAEFVLGLYGDRGMQNVAYVRLAKLLRTIGSVGKVIILGHGGSLATRELPGGVHVRLVAPLPIRASRMASVLDVDDERALQMIRQRDAEQGKLLKTHYRLDSANPELYDLVCNTERVSIDTVAELLLSLIRKRIA